MKGEETPEVYREIDEVKLATVAKMGVGILALKQLAKLFKLQREPQYSRSSITEYASSLANSKTDTEALVSIVGLLNVCSTALLRIDKLRFLGQKIQEVIKSDTLKKYIEEHS